MLENQNLVVVLIIIANVLFSMKGFENYTFFEMYKFQINKMQTELETNGLKTVIQSLFHG